MDKLPQSVYVQGRACYASSMRWMCQTILGVLCLASVSASAELLRFEFATQNRQFPATFEECEQRLRRESSVTVSWVDPVWYDANYTTTGGATVGNISYMRGTSGYNDTITWIRFDSVEVARTYELDAVSWASPYYVTRCEHEICLQVYSSTGQQSEILEVFEIMTTP